MLGINYSGIRMLYSLRCGRAKKKMADFVSENKCFLNEKEKTLSKRGYYVVRASDRSRKKKSNFEGFLGIKSQKNRPIFGNFRGKQSVKKQ